MERDSSLATAGGRLFGSRNSSKEIERVFVFNPETKRLTQTAPKASLSTCFCRTTISGLN